MQLQDTDGKIAACFHVTPAQLHAANPSIPYAAGSYTVPDGGTMTCSSPCMQLKPGDVLVIPPAATYAPPLPNLGIANGTTLAVTLVVNGTAIETVPPGGYQDPVAAHLPLLPWTVEARSPSGRLLTSMTVHAGETWATSLPNGEGSARGRGARVDLSCGRLDIWTGPPMSGPAPGTGSPGDCAP